MEHGDKGKTSVTIIYEGGKEFMVVENVPYVYLEGNKRWCKDALHLYFNELDGVTCNNSSFVIDQYGPRMSYSYLGPGFPIESPPKFVKCYLYFYVAEREYSARVNIFTHTIN